MRQICCTFENVLSVPYLKPAMKNEAPKHLANRGGGGQGVEGFGGIYEFRVYL